MASSPISPITPSGTSSFTLPGSHSRSPNQLWPNPLPLEGGIIRTQDKHSSAAAGLPKRFGLAQLKKLLLYLRDKGKKAYPNIRFVHWLQIASSRLDMTEDLAWLYFETFDVVSEINASDQLSFLKTVSSCSSSSEFQELRKRMSVNTLKFFLFLYLQNSPRYSLKSACMSGDEWPSPESDLRQKSSEQYHLVFLRANLHELLDLLQDSTHTLSEESVSALDLVFAAFKDSTKCSVLSLALSVPTQSGHSKATRSFNMTQFEFWLRSILTSNQCGPHSLFSRRKEIQPLNCFHSEGKGRVLSSSRFCPDLRCTLLYRINRQTLAISDESVNHSFVYVRNCQRSTMYILAPVRMVQVEKCSRCVLMFGAVASVVVINNCDSLTVITACRTIHVSSSTTCVLHLLTMTRPLLLQGCQHITLAPYNTHYPRQRSHLQLAGLIPDINLWDSPLDLAALGYGSKSERASNETPPIWGLMPPELFQPLEVPFDLHGSVEGIVCAIPPVYLRALAARKERIKRWYECVDRAGLSKEQSRVLWTTVTDHFEDWLVREGHKKELVDLGQKQSQFAVMPDGLSTEQNGVGSRSSPQQSNHYPDRLLEQEILT